MKKIALCTLLAHALCSQAVESPKRWFETSPEEIAKTCETSVTAAEKALRSVETLKGKRTFANTVLASEGAVADFIETVSPLAFLNAVSTDAKVRDASRACQVKADAFVLSVYARKDLYDAINGFAKTREYAKLESEDRRLTDKALLQYRRTGVALAEKQRKRYLELQSELIQLQNDFSKAIAEYKDVLELTSAELKGLPESYIQSLEKTEDRKRFKVTLAYPHYFPFMENARDAGARKRLYEKFSRRGGAENVRRLERAIVIRAELAKILGYPDHASYVLEDRMAKTPKNVERFLSDLKQKLEPLRRAELELMAKMKAKDDPKDPVIHEWDWRYYDSKILAQKYQVDEEAVREYFPLERVTQSMFDVYQTLFGVDFHEVAGEPVWYPGVKYYEVIDRSKNQVIANFYMDLFPRDDKYSHAAQFDIRAGRYDYAKGSYTTPIASIVANFTPGSTGRPPLLTHDEVATYFHEFGHVIHNVLTQAKYYRFSGTNVDRDFVEAPSQMLENWVWEPSMLRRISSHYKTGKPLPDRLIEKMVQARTADVGLKTCRQILFGTFDMAIHTATGAVETTPLWAKLQKEIMGTDFLEGAIPQASLGHFMGGYDAAYYGYLWSEVFAADMATRFRSEGWMNPKTGMEYRNWILAKGSTQEAQTLIEGFLGRPSNSDAFLRQLGLAAMPSSPAAGHQ